MTTWPQNGGVWDKNDSFLSNMGAQLSSGNTSTYVQWEGPKNSILGPLVFVAFPFPLLVELLEGFC